MRTVHSLEIGLRVPEGERERVSRNERKRGDYGAARSAENKDHSPIAIVQHDYIGSRKVNSQPTGPRREEENELFAPIFIVLVNRSDTVFVCGSSVDTAVLCGGKKREYERCS
jgi:hypothetical protein